MFRLLSLVCGLMLPQAVFGQTVFDISSGSASVTKTITKAMGVVRPLNVSSSIFGKLILEPGAILEMPASGWINVQWGGTLDCRGTAAEPVTIRASGTSWAAIITNYRQSASRPQIIMTHTNITGAIGGGARSAIEANHCSLLMDNVSITMPRADTSGRGYIAMNLGPNFRTSTGQLIDCVGVVSNCKFIGMTTGVYARGDEVDFIDCEAINCREPFNWQPIVGIEKPYHKFSTSR